MCTNVDTKLVELSGICKIIQPKISSKIVVINFANKGLMDIFEAE